jgi:hypothetical protein
VVTAVPGASVSYLGGFVTYATALKETLLGVPESLVERYGVVSSEVRTGDGSRVAATDGRDVRRGDDGRRRARCDRKASRSARCSSGSPGRTAWRPDDGAGR